GDRGCLPVPVVTLPPPSLLGDALALSRRFPPLRLLRSTLLPKEGERSQKRAGSGDVFWQYRPYLSGESAGRIDWRASARREHPLIREKEQATLPRIRLWLDASPSMRYASRAGLRTKLEIGTLLLTALADLAHRGNAEARAGLLPGSSPEKILARLATGGAWAEKLPLTKDKLQVIASDFLFDPDRLEKPLAAVRMRGGTGILLHLADPAEVAFPFQGSSRFEGLEGEASLLADDAYALRADYLAQWNAHAAKLEDIATRFDFTLIRCQTDAPLPESMKTLCAAVERSGS
ncbi:MAG: DUF58 domain-containing protein, partial [Alphaproteobacteria bacterium]|nr:DUF58 domain-containing protein [Alphaproteobacteria bacterium]